MKGLYILLSRRLTLDFTVKVVYKRKIDLNSSQEFRSPILSLRM